MQTNIVLYDYAMSFLGLPYIWGGDDPIKGFDCSGLVLEILQAVGVFPHGQDTTAAGLRTYFTDGRTESPRFGSLVFFGSTHPTHVGFCLNHLVMLEAGGGGSKTHTPADASAQNAYVRLRPIKNRKDCLGFANPPYPFPMGES